MPGGRAGEKLGGTGGDESPLEDFRSNPPTPFFSPAASDLATRIIYYKILPNIYF
jgi:hypothetical protein